MDNLDKQARLRLAGHGHTLRSEKLTAGVERKTAFGLGSRAAVALAAVFHQQRPHVSLKELKIVWRRLRCSSLRCRNHRDRVDDAKTCQASFHSENSPRRVI